LNLQKQIAIVSKNPWSSLHKPLAKCVTDRVDERENLKQNNTINIWQALSQKRQIKVYIMKRKAASSPTVQLCDQVFLLLNATLR